MKLNGMSKTLYILCLHRAFTVQLEFSPLQREVTLVALSPTRTLFKSAIYPIANVRESLECMIYDPIVHKHTSKGSS